MGAQTVQERSGVFFSFGYRNENNKTSDLDSADCVAKICWIIVPAATSEEKNPSDLMYTICACEICWDFVFFVILNLFKYFVDVFFDLLVLVHIAESMSLSWAVPMKPLILELFCG